jgi:hypothetical protein
MTSFKKLSPSQTFKWRPYGLGLWYNVNTNKLWSAFVHIHDLDTKPVLRKHHTAGIVARILERQLLYPATYSVRIKNGIGQIPQLTGGVTKIINAKPTSKNVTSDRNIWNQAWQWFSTSVCALIHTWLTENVLTETLLLAYGLYRIVLVARFGLWYVILMY